MAYDRLSHINMIHILIWSAHINMIAVIDIQKKGNCDKAS